MTAFRIINISAAFDRQLAAMRNLAGHCLFDTAAEIVTSKNANDEWRLSVRKGIGGPIDKLGEVEQIDRFEIVFGRGALSAALRGQAGQQRGNNP